MIKLSIITPYHNEPEEKINRMLQSVISQKDVDFNQIELIISNNCEVPNKLKFIELHEYPDDLSIIYTSSPVKNYIGDSRQHGINICRGEYFTFLDSDDTLNNTAVLKQILDTIEMFPKTDIFCYKERQQLYTEKGLCWGIIKENYVTPHAKVYKTQFIKSNKITHLSNIRYSEDTLFNLRCKINKPKLMNVDFLMYDNYFNKDSTTHNKPVQFLKDAAYSHCLGIRELAKIYKKRSTAVFNILVDSLLDLQRRIIKEVNFETAIRLTIHDIYYIIENIDDEKIEHKEFLSQIK